jgi:hypothetical protein
MTHVLTPRAAARAQPVVESSPRQAEHRQQPRSEPCGDPRRKGEEDNGGIDADFVNARDDGHSFGAHDVRDSNRHSETCGTSDQAKEHGFREQLSYESPATGS